MKNKKKGFTIVELVIVIAVIGILAAVFIPVFSGLVNKANLSADGVLIRELNNSLSIDSVEHGKHETMHDALKATDEYGFNVQRINAKASENKILWDSENDVFCYLKDGVVDYTSTTVAANKQLQAGDYRLWVIASDVNGTYSTYLYNYEGDGNIATQQGVDAGNENVTSISYTNTGSPQNVVIRTNGGSLTINAPGDIVNHYGYAEVLDVQAVDYEHSYHEYGISGFARIAQGHFVVESTGTVNVLYATGTKEGTTAVKVDNNSGVVGKAYATDDSVANELNNAPKQDGNIVLVKDTSVTAAVITAVTSSNISETVKTNETLQEVVLNSAFRGDGTEVSPFLISDVNELIILQGKVNGGNNYSGKYFKMTKDCDLSGINWIPIGNSDNLTFNGNFDGNNFTVKNLYLNNTSAEYQGLFGYLANATIKNVNIANANVVAKSDSGIIAGGVKSYNATVSFINCHIETSSIEVTGDQVGGICGRINDNAGTAVFTECSNNATITSNGDNFRAGGILGSCGSKNLTMTSCTNTGIINAKFAGGLLGATRGAAEKGTFTFTDCVNLGTLNGETTGKIIGFVNSGTLGEDYLTISVNNENSTENLFGVWQSGSSMGGILTLTLGSDTYKYALVKTRHDDKNGSVIKNVYMVSNAINGASNSTKSSTEWGYIDGTNGYLYNGNSATGTPVEAYYNNNNELVAIVRNACTADNFASYACYDSEGNRITDDSYINQWVKVV